MRRPAALALALAVSAASLVPAVALAQGPGARHHAAAGHGKPTPTLRVAVHAGAAAPGGILRLDVVVRSGKAGAGTALVHFASGDATVTLVRSGSGAALHGAVNVPAGTPLGPVAVDATVVGSSQTATASGFGRIVAPDEPSASPSAVAPSDSPSDAPSTAPSDAPSASPSAQPS